MEILGWGGAIIYLTAFALVSAKKTESDSWLFQGMNILAGCALIAYNFYLSAYPSAGLNIAWVGIAIITLARKQK